MFEHLKIKLAARRVSSQKKRNAAKKAGGGSLWSRALWVMCAPWRAIKKIWAWICRIDLVGLVNLTLLISIIVLFSMLIIDVLKWRNASVVIVADNAPSVVAATPDPNAVTKRSTTPSLPIKKDPETRKMVAEPITVAKSVKCPVAERQIARANGKMYGDIIVDNYANRVELHNGVQIKGNLYLQNMRKYTLPCDTHIDGNLFLRDVNMLHFCGDFTITGNIYVSPRSSFGPIPRTARLGGYVIL